MTKYYPQGIWTRAIDFHTLHAPFWAYSSFAGSLQTFRSLSCSIDSKNSLSPGINFGENSNGNYDVVTPSGHSYKRHLLFLCCRCLQIQNPFKMKPQTTNGCHSSFSWIQQIQWQKYYFKKRIAVPEPAISCIRNQHSTSEPQGHWKKNSIDVFMIMYEHFK